MYDSPRSEVREGSRDEEDGEDVRRRRRRKNRKMKRDKVRELRRRNNVKWANWGLIGGEVVEGDRR